MNAPFPTLLALLLLCAPATSASAQLIAPRTIPVATGDQFLVFPSSRLGMGGVSLALPDSLLDPFVNPAKAARLEHGRIFGAPTYYRVSQGDGDGRTLPVGAIVSGRRWFGAISAALQQLTAPEQRVGWADPGFLTTWDVIVPPTGLLRDQSSNNLYLFGSLGRRLADGGTALAASASYAGLEAVDGVDLLYALSQAIRQDGHAADFRVGLLRDLGQGSSAELSLLHHRIDMRHDVTYLEWRPDSLRRVRPHLREERNLDRTLTWGLHGGVVRPLGTSGWRLGGIATVNYLTHPKIPNYEIMNIPRDPGHSWAYNLGVGMARTEGPATIGVDVVLEPIWSKTWAEADTALTSRSGRRILPGERTVENEFAFANALLRMGLARETERAGFQLGLQVRSIRYELEQYDHRLERYREQDEGWMEWTPSWGLALRFPELEVRYAGRLTTGTGRPGVAWTGGVADAVALAATFLPAPSGPLTLQEARVVTHQVAVSLPLR